ncbi:hypothetical protein TNCV_4470781 [Trichonephila clavipes]|uniref:Transposase IS30-like HTH domain-containing protein n=1 Tax=Trichonephila clavipes TaxID=2585209 RepID=A0A8X6VAH8_TRICX|nr:hypothetical protein TNCV_4470781 [Trichonephila clavipes]
MEGLLIGTFYISKRSLLGKTTLLASKNATPRRRHATDTKFKRQTEGRFSQGHIVAYQDYGLSYRSIAARIGRDSMAVNRIWNRWVQDGNMDGNVDVT